MLKFLIEAMSLTIILYVFVSILPYLLVILLTVIGWILMFAGAVIDSILTFINRRRNNK